MLISLVRLITLEGKLELLIYIISTPRCFQGENNLKASLEF